MRQRSSCSLWIAAVVVFFVASASAQYIRFEDFSSVSGLALNGATHQATSNGAKVLRLTNGLRISGDAQSGTVWFQVKQPLRAGFTSYFAFQIHNPAACCTPGDGLAFVIQNSAATDYCAGGAGLTAIGAANGGVGYTGIRNSLAVEMDTAQDGWDPDANHVAVQSCGSQANSPVHIPGSFPICGGRYNVSSCLLDPNGISSNVPPLGVTCNGNSCQDGAVHQVVVEYMGAANQQPGNLKIFVDPPFVPGTHTPAANAIPQINIPLTIENTLSLDGDAAWVGFSASQSKQSQTQDLLAWEFTPHQNAVNQQIIQGGGTETTFTFGDHIYGVTYPADFQNTDGDYMTTEAIPINYLDFYNTRLAGTPFNFERCVTYLSTGGNCIYYRVTCQKSDKVTQIPCPNPPNDELIDTRTSYSTTDPVTAQNADYLKATIGTNDWISIFTGFSQDGADPTTSGRGNDFSDFVATFKALSHTGNGSLRKK